MGIMTIDGQSIEFTDEPNVLSVIRKAGIDIPTLCYHSELSIYGACRLCTVENDRGKTFASCSEKPKDGMVVYTNTPRLMRYRKLILELLLAAHCRDCTTCIKSGECHLQELAHRMGVHEIRFENVREQQPIDTSSHAIIRDPNKCILCGDCVRMCDNVQNINAIDFAYRGTEAQVMPAFNKKIAETDCVGCGQCRVVCPTGAISIRTNIDEVWEALADKNTKVIAQIAPAVRVAIGDHFGYAKGENVMGKLVGVLHRLGFDEVYDTSFSADLTIMEEGTELLGRLKSGEHLPMITSCSPGWINFAEYNYGDLLDHLSSCKSPHQMQGAIIKSYFAEKNGLDPKDIFVVSIMPCTAKKYEKTRPEMEVDGIRDVDAVLTTRELAKLIKRSGIDFRKLPDEEPDNDIMGEYSGAGVIFGVTGGVMEAALRTVYHVLTGDEYGKIEFTEVRGFDGIKEASLEINGTHINVAVAHGMKNARVLLDEIRAGKSKYQFIEVMGCPGGCIAGGGQPFVKPCFLPDEDIDILDTYKEKRANALYSEDERQTVRQSHNNTQVQQLYRDFLGEPNSHKAHELLHTHYAARVGFNDVKKK